MDIIEILDHLSEDLEYNYSNLNCGGCCCIAAMVARALQTHAPQTNPEVKVFSNGEDLDELRQYIEERGHSTHVKDSWRLAGLEFAHVVVEFEHAGIRYEFDSEGVRMPRDRWWDWYKSEGKIEISEAESVAADRYGWNFMFDRSQLPSIQQDIKLAFQEI